MELPRPTCPNGHEAPSDARFCPVCAAPLTSIRSGTGADAQPQLLLDRSRQAKRVRRQRLRRVLAITAAMAIAAVLTLTFRGGGGKPSPRVETNANSQSAAQTATTAARRPTSSPSTPPTGSRNFTVRSMNCGQINCTVGVRDGPGKSYKQVGYVDTGRVVQIDCSTHGEAVQDKDTGQQSDVWYRYAGTKRYS